VSAWLPILLPVKPVQHAVHDRREHEADATRNTRPAYSAYSPANTLPPSVRGGRAGPIPPMSIAAFKNASRQGSCSKYS
jgi:hypothetical protein